MPAPPSQTSRRRTREASAPSVSAEGWQQVDDVVAALREVTLARIWLTVETGQIGSKDEAASWAAARLPHAERAVVELAGAAYRGEAEDDWDARPGQAAAAAAAMTARIQLTSGQ